MMTVAASVPLEGCDGMNPVKAIRFFCLDCCGDSASAVKECTAKGCALYPFRLGTNPYRAKREMTDEQKEAAKARLSEARKKLNAERENNDQD